MTRFKLVFFSPKDSTRAILDHLFQKYPTEIGRIGEYEQCAFISRGTGQSEIYTSRVVSASALMYGA